MRQLGIAQMNVLSHNAKGATIHLDGKELLMVMVLIQEGRLSFQCDDPTGQALDKLFCSAVTSVEEARKTRQKMSALH
jgi:hypothetical protein